MASAEPSPSTLNNTGTGVPTPSASPRLTALLDTFSPIFRSVRPQPPIRPPLTPPSAMPLKEPPSLVTPVRSSTESNASPVENGEAFPEIPSSLMAIPPPAFPSKVTTLPADANISSSPDPSLGTRVSRTPSLMRKLSKGAASKLSLRRPAAPHRDQRDHSSGPVIMRRRSDSKSGYASASARDPDFGFGDGHIYDALGTWNGPEGDLSIDEYVLSLASVATGVTPKVDSSLQCGSRLTKVNKKKKRETPFFLDIDTAKVYWDFTNPSKRIYIDDIKGIRVGPDARNYREEHNVPEEFENCWFTIIFANPEGSRNRPVKTLHLIAPNEETRKLWTTTLEDISRYRIGLMVGLAGSGQSENILKAHWQREISRRYTGDQKMEEDDARLDLGGVERLCQSLHIDCSKDVLRAQFSRVDPSSTGKLGFIQFKEIIQGLKDRKDVRAIFETAAADPTNGLTLAEFLQFVGKTQGEELSGNYVYWSMVFEKFVRRARIRSQSLPDTREQLGARMDLDAFSAFLLSPANGIYPSRVDPPVFDRPLNEYFISSSHNTYLLGRQVAGSSSTEAYIAALQKGCRCVEIDCWDGTDGRPRVSHGRTMTTSVLFADCISVINRYAFVSSEYPLILSLDVHCSGPQQLAMVEIMKNEFGNQLLSTPLRRDWQLPSPEDLKGRILIKVKTADEPEEAGLPPTGRKRSFSSPFVRSSYSSGPPPAAVPFGSDDMYPRLTRSQRTSTSVSSSSEDTDGGLAPVKRRKKKTKRSKIVKPLAGLGIYTRGYKWDGFASPESSQYNHVYSFAEKVFEEVSRDGLNKVLLDDHNIRYLTRVYPSGFRFSSSNFDPIIFWKRGVQMVAMNWQTYDVGMQINQAMFAGGNDRTGYILKPPSLRPCLKESIKKTVVSFQVDVISAQQLPRSKGMGPDENINPFIEIEVFTADERVDLNNKRRSPGGRTPKIGTAVPLRRRTRIVQKNGYNPIFHDGFTLRLETTLPELIFIRWTVFNSPDGRNVHNAPVLATFTAKYGSLNQGYRYLPLYDEHGDQFLFSSLFCKITKLEDDGDTMLVRGDPEHISERTGLFRQLSQSVFRALSTEKPRGRSKASRRNLQVNPLDPEEIVARCKSDPEVEQPLQQQGEVSHKADG